MLGVTTSAASAVLRAISGKERRSSPYRDKGDRTHRTPADRCARSIAHPARRKSSGRCRRPQRPPRVDDRLIQLQARKGRDEILSEPCRPIEPTSSEELNPAGSDIGLEPVAIEFDLMQPLGTGGRAVPGAGEHGRNKARIAGLPRSLWQSGNAGNIIGWPRGTGWLGSGCHQRLLHGSATTQHEVCQLFRK